MKKHIISALVANRPGVLAHMAGLFSARGFNIDSLAVGETEDPNLSRLTHRNARRRGGCGAD